MKEIFLEKHEGINDVYMMKAKNTDDVDLDYLLKCKCITKKLYNEMQGKNIYEIVYRYVDDAYPSAGSWWFKNKQERDDHWNKELKRRKHVKIYTVWVGGIEVTDYLVNYQQANEILKRYLDDGYTDIKIEKIEEK